MAFRHEYKIEINQIDMLELRQRLGVIMKPDPHALNGSYRIRSLYFDDIYDHALREKIDGVNEREKFRIRMYNDNPDLIKLEKKSKVNGLCCKVSEAMTPEETKRILDGETEWMRDSGRPLLEELYAKMHSRGLKPKTLVDYTRDPFIYGPGNVRVTLDYNIRTGLYCTDFLNPDCITIPAGDAPAILEVKWDAFLPDAVRSAVQLRGRRVSTFSKYAACRIYG